MKKKIIISSGGTAGHLFPALTLTQELVNRGYEIHIVTDIRCSKYLDKNLRYVSHVLNFRFHSKGLFKKVIFYSCLITTTIKMFFLLFKIKPNAIIGFGGYVTVSPLLAAVLLKIPIVLYEQNLLIGKANRFFIKYAKKIALAYKDIINLNTIDNTKTIVVGSIVRQNIKSIKTIKRFNNNNIFRILVLGGSQGAKIFSTLIPEAIKILVTINLNINFYITQQASLEDHHKISKFYDVLGVSYELSEFFSDISKKYEKQELVISRAGASTISELSTLGIPAIFIPLPFIAENHQLYNAKAIENSGAGWYFEQNTFTAQKLAHKISLLVRNPALLYSASCKLLKIKNDGNIILSNIIDEIVS